MKYDFFVATKLYRGGRRLTFGKAEQTMYFEKNISSNAERLVAILLAVAIVAALAV